MAKKLTDIHILIVEDDPDISSALAAFLASKGYVTSLAASAEAAEVLLVKHSVNVVLLDIMLPEMSGLELCRRLRAAGGTPAIIIVTAIDDPVDKVVGLELGADDYVTKPFDLPELVARIRAVLRRPPAAHAPTRENARELVLQFAEFTFYPYRRYVRTAEGLRTPLTGAETNLLLVFCQHPQQVLSREALIGLTRGEDFPIASRSIDLLVSRLRRKLARRDAREEIISTVRADGYRLEPQVRSA